MEILADPRHTDAIEATAREMESEVARLDLGIAEAETLPMPSPTALAAATSPSLATT